MSKLLLIRHGQTTWNAERRIQGHQDSPLSEEGLRQAEAIAGRLSIVRLDAIYTSDLARACRTAEAINVHHRLPLRTLVSLREANLGRWEGRTVADLEKDAVEADLLALWRTDSATNRPPGGERLEELQARAVAAVQRIVEAHPAGTIAVVTHGGVVKAVVSWALGLPIDRQRRFVVGNASLTRLSIDARGATLECLNDVSHWSETVESPRTRVRSDDAP